MSESIFFGRLIGDLIQEIIQWCSSADDLKLSTLSRIEDSITGHNFHNFSSFGYGSFLEFVTKEPEISKILEERNALLGNVSASMMSPDNGVLDFVQQCGSSSPKVQINVIN